MTRGQIDQMTPIEKSRLVAKWLGYEWQETGSRYDGIGYYDPKATGKVQVLAPFALSITSAVMLLPILVQKGYGWDLQQHPRGGVDFALTADGVTGIETEAPTIAQAIVDAILFLVKE